MTASVEYLFDPGEMSKVYGFQPVKYFFDHRMSLVHALPSNSITSKGKVTGDAVAAANADKLRFCGRISADRWLALGFVHRAAGREAAAAVRPFEIEMCC